MKFEKIIAVFAVAAILISSCIGKAVPFLQRMILQPKEETDTVYSKNELLTVELKKGDCLYFGEYLEEPILWEVLDVLKDGKVLIMSKHVICFKAFDSCGADINFHNGADTQKYGSSDWECSTLKEWLNSSEQIVSYSHCPPDANSVYLGCNAYSREKGFLCEENFVPQLKNMISAEGIFLLGTEDLKKYFTNVNRAKTCTQSAIVNSDSPYLITAKVWYWTLSSVSSNNVSVAAVTSSGSFYKTLAYDSTAGVCPALYLKKADVPVYAGNGSAESPYLIGWGKK